MAVQDSFGYRSQSFGSVAKDSLHQLQLPNFHVRFFWWLNQVEDIPVAQFYTQREYEIVHELVLVTITKASRNKIVPE